jgi:hypothetical protein
LKKKPARENPEFFPAHEKPENFLGNSQKKFLHFLKKKQHVLPEYQEKQYSISEYLRNSK